MIGIVWLAVFCVFCLSLSAKVIATSYRDPTSKTNVNVQTDLFRKSVGDVEAFKNQVREDEKEAVEKLRSGGDHGVEFIAGTSRKEIDENTSELSTIKADELNDRGSTQLLREKLLEEIYVDESNPLMVAHRKDAERIAEGSKDLLGSLLFSLKERLGVDCYTVKGNKEIDPEHRIALKEEQIKETIYDQTMCEESRNRYSCHDSLTVRCIKRGMKWGAWQDKTIIIPYQSIPWHWWIRSYFRPTDTRVANSFNRFTINPVYHQEIAIYIASAIGVSLSQINVGTQDITVTHIWDALYPGYSQNVVSNTLRGGGIPSGLSILNGLSVKASKVTFYYQYRSGSEICAEWVDEWDEVCGLEP